MSQDWLQKMDLGVVHFMLYPVIRDEGPIAESFEALALDEFVSVIEVRRSEQPGMHARLRAIAETTGVKIGVGAQPGLLLNKLSLNDPDEAGRQAAIEEVKKSIDAAYEMGARICAALSGPMPEGEDEVKRQMDLLVDSCVQIAQYSLDKAQDYDYVVWLSLEQFDATIDKRCLIGPSVLAAELGERVREQVANFGLTIDLSHIPLLGEEPTELVSTTMPYVIHVHVGNCLKEDPNAPVYGDKHPRFGYPGSESDWPELKDFIEILTYGGYFGKSLPTEKPVVTFEVTPAGDETPEQVWAGTKRTWLRAWSEVGVEERLE
ncbi:MAG: TIM barrel protein [Armatimonadetes bacterium]|nr:TIM barrel protein [Armatimonadota bacterium]